MSECVQFARPNQTLTRKTTVEYSFRGDDLDANALEVPGKLLVKLMQFERTELFVNVIWRELDMAIIQARSRDGRMATTLDEVFDGGSWRSRVVGETRDERAESAIDLIKEMCGAKWATTVRMLGANGQTRYILLHLSNHESGRDLMKDCIWKSCPEGGYYARRSDNPSQTRLIAPEPDLKDLEHWVLNKLAEGPKHWSDLAEAVREELWRDKHLNSIVRQLRKDKRIEATQYEGRFSRKADPLLVLSSDD